MDALLDLPKLDHLPVCEEDARYTKSFDCNRLESFDAEFLNEVYSFFDEYGFVVISNVYTPIECELTRAAMWEIIEFNNCGINRNDPKTWSSLKSKGQYGLSIRGPSFHPILVKNRQNASFAKVLAKLTGAIDEKDVIASQDRFTVYRATVFDDPSICGELFSTGDKNLHLDMNPWWWEEDAMEIKDGINKLTYMDTQDFIKENNLVVRSFGRHVQCVLNFADNLEDDGGTLIVPFFHRFLREWNRKYKNLRKNLPWVTLPMEIQSQLLQYAHRVTMREGSILIWDQRVMHGTSPNESARCRLAQYLKAGPRNSTFPVGVDELVNSRLQKRSQNLNILLEKSINQGDISPLGVFLFGLDIL